RVGAPEAVQLRRAGLRASQPRMKLVDETGGAGVTGANRALKRLPSVLELLEVGVTGKSAGWHRGLLSPEPGVRNLGRKGEPTASPTILVQVGFALSADRQHPARTPIINPHAT